MDRKIEIMAPAGSFESLQAAIQAGADSVYFGVDQLNMRSRAADNFKIEEIAEIRERTKKAGVKCYLTLNTLLYEHDLALMKKIMDEAKKQNVDAAILQDIAAIQYASEIGLPVHASTQLSISNYESVKFYSRFADTIVLAREVDIMMMKKICEKIKTENLCGPSGKPVRIEVFVHGALCIAQSGRCQMSLLQNNTSAQRGACLQECRKKYKITDEETGKEMIVDNQYVLSPKDLCCLPFLDKLIDSGVSVLKIEGRGRAPDYVFKVVSNYKKAVELIEKNDFTQKAIDEMMEDLKTVYNRGFSDGYYLGKSLPEWSGPSGNKSTEERVYVGIVNHYFDKAKIAELNVQAYTLKKGDKLAIMGKNTGFITTVISEMKKDEAFVEESGKQCMITIPLEEKIRKNDKIYVIKQRNLNVIA